VISIFGLTYAPAVLISLVLIFTILVGTTCVVGVIGWKRPERRLRTLELRVKTWWWIVALVALALGYPENGVYVVFGIVSFLAFKELISHLPTRQVDGPLILLGIPILVLQYYFAAHHETDRLFMIFGWVFLPVLMVFVMVFMQERTSGFVKEIGGVLLLFLITIYAPSHLAHFFALPQGGSPSGAAGLVLFVLILAQVNDLMQFVVGRNCDRRKIVPNVSSRRTWDGFLSAWVVTVPLAVLIADSLTPFSPLQALLFGSLIAPLGFLGSIFVEAIKRDLEVRSTSAFLPGHGGVLDRIGSLLFVAPVYFHLVYHFVYEKGGLV